MIKYAFWNNKGGTGKTSLAFQAITMFAGSYPRARILVIDLCPQANLSELLLGGLVGGGSNNLNALHNQATRKSVGGYFQKRLPFPFAMPNINPNDYLSKPSNFNINVPYNIDLLAGDALLELQSNAISTLANTQIPGTNTWLSIIDWMNDFIYMIADNYDYVFIDSNPSFSIYTQIALATSDRIILPVMADDSSRRAVQNAIALTQGINLPSPIYQQHNFASMLINSGRNPPKFHLFVKNRLTQYMGPASAYYAVLTSIDNMINSLILNHPWSLTFSNLEDGVVEIRDFQTTGVVSFAMGMPFSVMRPRIYRLPDRDVQVRADYLQNCMDAMYALVNKI